MHTFVCILMCLNEPSTTKGLAGTGTGTHALKTMVAMLQGKIDTALAALPPVNINGNSCNFETLAEAKEMVERLRALLLA